MCDQQQQRLADWLRYVGRGGAEADGEFDGDAIRGDTRRDPGTDRQQAGWNSCAFEQIERRRECDDGAARIRDLDRGHSRHRSQRQHDSALSRPLAQPQRPALRHQREPQCSLDVQPGGHNQARDQGIVGRRIDARVRLSLGQRDGFDRRAGKQNEGHSFFIRRR